MKENSIEEDIKTINNFIAYFNKNIQHGYRADLTILGEEIEAIEHILSDYKRVLKANEKLIEENSELKHSLLWRIGYCQDLEKDLFENCEKYVINKETIKNKIKEYEKLSDEFYDKFCKLSPLDLKYRNIRDAGMCCNAKVNVLQELLKG